MVKMNHGGTERTKIKPLAETITGVATKEHNAAKPQPKPEMKFLTQSPPRTPRQDWDSIPPDLYGLCVRCVRSKNSDPDFVVAREDFDLKEHKELKESFPVIYVFFCGETAFGFIPMQRPPRGASLRSIPSVPSVSLG